MVHVSNIFFALTSSPDRYGGVEAEVSTAAEGRPFDAALTDAMAGWAHERKEGIWLRIPLACAECVGAAAAQGFEFHHARPEYVMMTRWLPTDRPSPLPRHGFT